ncbi:hypothetical protein [Stratiformator vulcanicus]|uniref:Uncharacterized protein n=1 Tax=Stratiformator vulcanicus TaxID=2527980 RepID=A0A517R519_9PLAN|nr:hypothetical protein [Stratiformator vulcanicus]QDT38985.1 hypothetical protein Pan189_33850 [Stratiformator vulcanicus]
MSRITIDRPEPDKLTPDGSVAEVVDREGKLLGYFVPAGREENLQPQISDAAYESRITDGGGRSMRDAIDELRAKS